eukprot:scaffold22533_cov17-Tisochrysis_lutea.AAC.1
MAANYCVSIVCPGIGKHQLVDDRQGGLCRYSAYLRRQLACPIMPCLSGKSSFWLPGGWIVQEDLMSHHYLVQEYLEVTEKANGHYLYRWGDAAIHTMVRLVVCDQTIDYFTVNVAFIRASSALVGAVPKFVGKGGQELPAKVTTAYVWLCIPPQGKPRLFKRDILLASLGCCASVIPNYMIWRIICNDTKSNSGCCASRTPNYVFCLKVLMHPSRLDKHSKQSSSRFVYQHMKERGVCRGCHTQRIMGGKPTYSLASCALLAVLQASQQAILLSDFAVQAKWQ